jgi:type VI secretion system protein ImpA
MTDPTSIPGFEVAALLAPIADDAPAGEDLYREAPQLHREVGNLLPTGLVSNADARAQRGQDALDALLRLREALQRSKDLGLVTPMVRALLRVHGFDGLRLGLVLLRELHAQYWPTMYPAPLAGLTITTADSTDEAAVNRELRALKARRALINQCEYALRTEIKGVAVCPPIENDAGDYTIYRWEVAHQEDALVPMDRLRQAAQRRPRAHYEQMHAVITACIDECGRLTSALKPLYTRPEVPGIASALEPPSFATLREALRQCAAIIAQLVAQAPAPATTAPEAAAVTSEAGAPTAALIPGRFNELSRPPRATLTDRTEALGLLAHAAGFLHQLEPLSPVPYFVAKVVTWGSLSSIGDWLGTFQRGVDPAASTLHELLRELGVEKREPEATPARASSPLRGLLRWLEGEGRPASTPSAAPLPELKSRGEALALIGDVAAFLYQQEPLSPLPHLLRRVLRWAQADSPLTWLTEVMDGADPTLVHILKTLDLAAAGDPAGESLQGA